MGLLCSHWGLSTKTPTQDSLSSVSCCFLGWVPQWDWRLEGKREEEWELWRCAAFSPSTFTDIYTAGNSRLHFRYLKHWNYGPNHCSFSAVNGENERDAQEGWTIPQDLFQLGWTQALLSAVTEPETRHHLSLFTISFLWLWQKFWPVLRFKYFALSRLRRKGEGFFPYGFLI